jgi:hypothetical protein
MPRLSATEIRTTRSTRPSRPNLVVGWAAGVVQVWPAEDLSIGAELVRRHTAA